MIKYQVSMINECINSQCNNALNLEHWALSIAPERSV